MKNWKEKRGEHNLDKINKFNLCGMCLIYQLARPTIAKIVVILDFLCYDPFIFQGKILPVHGNFQSKGRCNQEDALLNFAISMENSYALPEDYIAHASFPNEILHKRQNTAREIQIKLSC